LRHWLALAPALIQGVFLTKTGKELIKAIERVSGHLRSWALRDREDSNLAINAGKFLMASHDMETAEKTYGSFITLLKVAIPVLAITTLIVLVLIAE